MTPTVLFAVTRDGGQIPERQTEGSAGLDCYAAERTALLEGKRARVPLGFAVEMPSGLVGKILPRSGHSLRGIDVIHGTIDSDYRLEVSAVVVNNTGAPIVVQKGDRICQMVIEAYPTIAIMTVDAVEQTGRGGFGSTGTGR